MSYPNDWVQLTYTDENQTGIPPITTVTASEGGGGTSAPRNNDQPLDRGHRARPIRRRSRASRRTPTTLLNTDTTNFRAMVQQFTGGPAAASTPHLTNATGIFEFRQHIVPNQGIGAQVQYYPVPNQMHVQQQRRHVFMAGDTHAHAPPGSSAPNGSRGYDNYML